MRNANVVAETGQRNLFIESCPIRPLPDRTQLAT